MSKSICNFSKVLVLVLLVGLSACKKQKAEKAEKLEKPEPKTAEANQKALLSAHKWEVVSTKLLGKISPVKSKELYEFLDDGVLEIGYKHGRVFNTDTWTLEGNIIIIDTAGDKMLIEKLDEKYLTVRLIINSNEATLYFEKYNKNKM